MEDALQASAQDLKYTSTTIQADLDRFQRQKVADLRDMTIAMARSHVEWSKKVCLVQCFKIQVFMIIQNLAAWEEVRKEVANIERHPNDEAAGEVTVQSDSAARPSPAVTR